MEKNHNVCACVCVCVYVCVNSDAETSPERNPSSCPTSFPSPPPGSEGRKGVLVQCDLPAPSVARTFPRRRVIPGEGPRYLPWHSSSQLAAGPPVQARGTALPSLSSAPSSLLAFSGLGGLALKPVGKGEGNQVSCLVSSSSVFLGLLCPSLYVSLDLCLSFPAVSNPSNQKASKRGPGSPAGKPSWEITLESVNPSTHQSHFSSLCRRQPAWCLSCSA